MSQTATICVCGISFRLWIWYCPLEPVPIKAIRAFSLRISLSFSGVQEDNQGVVLSKAVPPAMYPRLFINCLRLKSTPFSVFFVIFL